MKNNNQYRVAVIDDEPRNVKLLSDQLENVGYQVKTGLDGSEAVTLAHDFDPHVLLLDVVMPGMSGYEVCQQLKGNELTAIIPIVLVTGLDPAEERIKGLDAGADDFLTKPVSPAELLARVRSLVRVKSLFEQVKEKSAELEILNDELEQRVQTQVEQIQRLGRLRRFLSPHVADMVVSETEHDYLASHRRDIAILFCDLRGFTAFSESTSADNAISVLGEYHHVLGELISGYDATIDHRAGDGMMVFLNDPIVIDRPAVRAIELAMDMRSRVQRLLPGWSRFGSQLGFGIGVSYGPATIGLVGYADRFDYAASGRFVNLASRLCDVARDGQILVTGRVMSELGPEFVGERVPDISMPGVLHPPAVFAVGDKTPN